MPGSERAEKYLERRFGVEAEDLSPLELVERSGDFWLSSPPVESYELETAGVRMLRSTDRGLKPTSYGLQLLGDFIEKNRFEATRAQLKRLLAREEMFDADLEENGYVAIVFNDRVIGCGFYAKGVVSSRIPKGRSEELMESL